MILPALFHFTGVAGSIAALALGFPGMAFTILVLSTLWTVLSLSHYLKK